MEKNKESPGMQQSEKTEEQPGYKIKQSLRTAGRNSRLHMQKGPLGRKDLSPALTRPHADTGRASDGKSGAATRVQTEVRQRRHLSAAGPKPVRYRTRHLERNEEEELRSPGLREHSGHSRQGWPWPEAAA